MPEPHILRYTRWLREERGLDFDATTNEGYDRLWRWSCDDLAAFWQSVQKRQDTLVDETAVQTLIDARAAARKAKNFAESDRIRDELAAMGVVLKDSKDGTTWELAR